MAVAVAVAVAVKDYQDLVRPGKEAEKGARDVGSAASSDLADVPREVFPDVVASSISTSRRNVSSWEPRLTTPLFSRDAAVTTVKLLRGVYSALGTPWSPRSPWHDLFSGGDQ